MGMTPERLEQIRTRYAAHGSHCHAPECNAWTCTVHELLAEVNRLRAAADGLKVAVCDENNAAMILRDMGHHGEGVEASECCRFVLDRGRELGLFAEVSE